MKHLILADPWGFPGRIDFILRIILLNIWLNHLNYPYSIYLERPKELASPLWVRAIAKLYGNANPLWILRAGEYNANIIKTIIFANENCSSINFCNFQ